MENKYLILILVAVIAVVAVAAVVISNGNGGVDVGGLKFNVPEKYVEDTKYTENLSGVEIANITVNASDKVFRNGTDGVKIVVYETESPDVAKEFYDNTRAKMGSGAVEKTVNGKNVMVISDSQVYSYVYNQDKYLVVFESPNQTLLDSIVQ